MNWLVRFFLYSDEEAKERTTYEKGFKDGIFFILALLALVLILGQIVSLIVK